LFFFLFWQSQYVFLHEAFLEAYMSRNTRVKSVDFRNAFPQHVKHDKPNQRADAEFEVL
jgi:hypothetical protein